jgi:hypothetical protein
MQLYFVKVKPCKKPKGMLYEDAMVHVDHFDDISENVQSLIQALQPHITEQQSIILRREDVLRFVDSIVEHTDLTAKELFEKIRRCLRREFDVCRIRFNPRTMARQEKVFIIHKRSFT